MKIAWAVSAALVYNMTQTTRLLRPGIVTARQLDLLVLLTRTKSEDVIAALCDHLVKGWNLSNAANMNGVSPANLQRAFYRLERAAQIIEQYTHLQEYKDQE